MSLYNKLILLFSIFFSYDMRHRSGIRVITKANQPPVLTADALSSFYVFYRCASLHPHEIEDPEQVRRVRVDLRFKSSDLGVKMVDRLKDWVDAGGLGGT